MLTRKSSKCPGSHPTTRGSVVARRDGRGWSAAGQCGVEGDVGSVGGGEFCLDKWFDIDKYCLGGDSSHILCSSVLCSWPRLTAGLMNTHHELASEICACQCCALLLCS